MLPNSPIVAANAMGIKNLAGEKTERLAQLLTIGVSKATNVVLFKNIEAEKVGRIIFNKLIRLPSSLQKKRNVQSSRIRDFSTEPTMRNGSAIMGNPFLAKP